MRLAVRRPRWRRFLIWLLGIALCVLCYLLLGQNLQLFDRRTSSLKASLVETAKDFPWNAPQQQPQRQPTSLQSFQERSKRLRETCLARSEAAAQKRPYPYHILQVKSMVFCSLAKTGSTFWKRILYYVDKNMTGPLMSHSFGDIHDKTSYLLKPPRSLQTDKYHTIVFVREPYARLYSAYVDKLFKPRVSNWRRYARPAMNFSRYSASTREINCSHNVTFAEFVRYFIHVELHAHTDKTMKRDEHFVPISQQCNFCGHSYDFVGRQEAFAEDTLGILAQLNVSAMLAFSDFKDEYAKYEMDALIRYTFEHEIDKITRKILCMTREEVLRRLWKSFQIGGTLSAGEFFPLATSDALKITKEEFLQIAMLAYNRSAIDMNRKRNTKESMLEAYSTIPLKDRNMLRQIFDEDFKFFSYDPNHPLVFPPEDDFQLPYYRYFDVFDSFLFSKVD